MLFSLLLLLWQAQRHCRIDHKQRIVRSTFWIFMRSEQIQVGRWVVLLMRTVS
jgi:hypothetical protein